MRSKKVVAVAYCSQHLAGDLRVKALRVQILAGSTSKGSNPDTSGNL